MWTTATMCGYGQKDLTPDLGLALTASGAVSGVPVYVEFQVTVDTTTTITLLDLPQIHIRADPEYVYVGASRFLYALRQGWVQVDLVSNMLRIDGQSIGHFVPSETPTPTITPSEHIPIYSVVLGRDQYVQVDFGETYSMRLKGFETPLVEVSGDSWSLVDGMLSALSDAVYVHPSVFESSAGHTLPSHDELIISGTEVWTDGVMRLNFNRLGGAKASILPKTWIRVEVYDHAVAPGGETKIQDLRVWTKPPERFWPPHSLYPNLRPERPYSLALRIAEGDTHVAFRKSADKLEVYRDLEKSTVYESVSGPVWAGIQPVVGGPLVVTPPVPTVYERRVGVPSELAHEWFDVTLTSLSASEASLWLAWDPAVAAIVVGKYVLRWPSTPRKLKCDFDGVLLRTRLAVEARRYRADASNVIAGRKFEGTPNDLILGVPVEDDGWEPSAFFGPGEDLLLWRGHSATVDWAEVSDGNLIVNHPLSLESVSTQVFYPSAVVYASVGYLPEGAVMKIRTQWGEGLDLPWDTTLPLGLLPVRHEVSEITVPAIDNVPSSGSTVREFTYYQGLWSDEEIGRLREHPVEYWDGEKRHAHLDLWSAHDADWTGSVDSCFARLDLELRAGTKQTIEVTCTIPENVVRIVGKCFSATSVDFDRISVTAGAGEVDTQVVAAYIPEQADEPYSSVKHGIAGILDLFEGAQYRILTDVRMFVGTESGELFQPSTLSPPQPNGLVLYDGLPVHPGARASHEILFTVPHNTREQHPVLRYCTDGTVGGLLRIWPGTPRAGWQLVENVEVPVGEQRAAYRRVRDVVELVGALNSHNTRVMRLGPGYRPRTTIITGSP